MSRVAFCVVAMLAASMASATSIKWTGIANNGQWETSTNWYPAQVPGVSDDVTINSGGNVTITSPQTVSSISMGNDVGHFPFLIVDSSLLVENTFTVNANGGIVMNSGAAQVTGTVVMGGNLIFSSGVASGSWTLASPGKATLGGGAEKAFSACTFSIGIDVDVSGLVVLNQSSVVSTTATIAASGSFALQNGDSTAVSFDTSKGTFSYTGGSTGVFQAMAPWTVGTFDFVSGNVTLFESVTFGSAFSVPSGSALKTLGTAAVALPAGLTGSGYVHVEGATFSVGGANFSGTINAQAGSFSSSSASSIAMLIVSGSTLTVDHAFNVAQAMLVAGQIVGTSTLTIGSSNLMSAGFNINATTVITSSFKASGSVISLGSLGSLHISNGATFTADSTTSISGPANTGGIVNNGMINAAGAFSVTNIDITGTGSITVSEAFTVGTLTIKQGVIALTGNGKFLGATTDLSIGKITGTPVTGSIGAYSFQCPKECDSVSTSGIPTTNFIFSA